MDLTTYRASTIQESLTEAQLLDYRRRHDTTTAIVVIARGKFPERKKLDERLRERQHAKWPDWWFWGTIVVGGLIHHFFRDAAKSFDFTFGSLMILFAVILYASFHFENYRLQRQLTAADEYRSELLYRWLANGGSYDEFYRFRDLAEGEKDLSEWWTRQEAHLLGCVTGKFVKPG